MASSVSIARGVMLGQENYRKEVGVLELVIFEADEARAGYLQ